MSQLLDKPWFNVIWFNIFWLLAVNGQSSFITALFLLLIFHFIFVSNKINELLTIFSISLFGCSIDLLLSLNNFYIFPQSETLPIWLILLWMAFSTTLTRCFRFLTIGSAKRIFMSSIIGGFGGGFSYFSAYKLGAVEFPLPWQQSLSMLIIIWAVLFPTLILIKDKCASFNIKKVTA